MDEQKYNRTIDDLMCATGRGILQSKSCLKSRNTNHMDKYYFLKNNTKEDES